MMNRREALNELRKCSHIFLTKEGVKKIGESFGVGFGTRILRDNRSEIGGLTLFDSEEGDLGEGLGFHELAERIYMKLELSIPFMNGRGSRLQVACEAIDEYLKKRGE